MNKPCVVVNVYRNHPYDVYVGRAGKGKDGTFGNPYTKAQHGDEALDLFFKYFIARVEKDPDFRGKVLALAGKRLGCFCVREPWIVPTAADDERGALVCHAQIVAKWVWENAR